MGVFKKNVGNYSGKKKKWPMIVGVILVLALISIITSGGDDNENKEKANDEAPSAVTEVKDEKGPENEFEEESEEQSEITAEESTEGTEELAEIAAEAEELVEEVEEKPAEEVSASNDELIDAWIVIGSALLEKNFDDRYRVEKTEEGAVSVSVWQDGVSLGAMLAKAGDANSKEAWDVLKSNMSNMSLSMIESMEAMGIQNPVLMVNILNDQNLDNTLLSMINGVVVFDAAE